MSRRWLRYSALLLALTAVDLRAQDVEGEPSSWLRVRSNLPSSLVFVDSTYVGRADGSLHEMPAGVARVVLTPTEVGAWGLTQPESAIELGVGDTLSIVLDFLYQYRIDSVPFGAIVTIPSEDRRVLGTTPLVFSREAPLRARLLLEKAGYANAGIQPGEAVINRHSIALRALDVNAGDGLAVEWNPKGSKNSWINWAAAGTVAAGGALAVHFKFKADDWYDLYLETGDPEFKDQVQQYDTYSYVALAGMQVGIGVLVFRLAF